MIVREEVERMKVKRELPITLKSAAKGQGFYTAAVGFYFVDIKKRGALMLVNTL